MRILILRFSSLGDITMATVLPRVLRAAFPDAVINMAVRSDYKDLIEYNMYIDNKIYLEKSSGIKGLFRLAKEIQNSKYDLIIDAHKSIRSRFICLYNFFVKKAKIDKRTFKRLLLIFLKINFFKKVDLQMIEYIKPVNKYGVEYDGKGTEIFMPKDAQKQSRTLLSTAFKNFSEVPLIGIVPSAQWPGKRWPSAKFKELIKLIVLKHKVNIVIIAGQSDQKFCRDLCNDYSNVVSFAGRLSVIGSASVLSFCDFVVSNDTGMMHVSEAVGTRVIAIMGPTSQEFGCYPYRSDSKVVETKMWCRPCSKNGSGICIRFGKRPCLNSISPELVLSKVEEYLC